MKKLGLNTESEYRKRFLRIEHITKRLKALHEKGDIFVEPNEGHRVAQHNYLDEKDAFMALRPRAHTLAVQLSHLIEWHERIVTDEDFVKLMEYADIHVSMSREIHDAVKVEVVAQPIRAQHFNHHFRCRAPALRAAIEMFKNRAFARGI